MIKKPLLLMLATAIVGLVTACGGGGGGGGTLAPGSSASTPTSPPTLPPSGNATAGPTLQMSLTVTIPGKKSSSRARGPQYIAPNSGSMTLTLLSVNGATVQATAQGPYNLVPGPTNPNCVAGTNTTCTFQISAPVGNDIFLANTFAAGSGAALGSGAIVLSVRQNATNTANLSLTGPVASVQLFSAATTLYNGNPVPAPSNSDESLLRGGGAQAQAVHKARVVALASQSTVTAGVRKPAGAAATPAPVAPTVTTTRLFVIALDANGNQIISPTTFDVPINLVLSLNGLPAGAATLTVTYAGLPGEGSPVSTSSDQGSVTVLAPADAVTLTLTGTSSQTSSFAPTIAASYTPQAIGTLQTSAPLAFTIIVPPAAAELNASASHVDPLTVGVPANLTDAYLNIGTAPTSGQLEAQFWPTNLTYNGYVGSDPSWTCTNQGSYVDCLSNAVVQPNGSLPLVFQVTPTGNPAYNELDVFGGNAVNANTDILYVDPINVNNTPIVSLAITSINDNGGTFYTNVQGAYTITLTNQGALASSGAITLTDTLPANFAYNSFSGAGWACVGPAPTITCTYAGSIAAATSAPVTINVTPALALQDTNVSSSISGSGGGASPFGPNTTNEAVVGPIQFVSQSLGSNALLGATTGFAPTSGDQATLDIGYPPGGAGLAGNMSIVALDGFAGHYGIGSDNCTGPVMDTTFSTALGSTSANGASVVNFGINVIAATQAGPCSIQITDTNGNVANLSIQVESSGFTIQSRARKPITGASHR